MTPLRTILLVALLATFAPAASAAPAEPTAPVAPSGCPPLRDCLQCLAYGTCGVGYCGEFFVDWNHCEGQLICVVVVMAGVREGACVPLYLCDAVACETCLPQCAPVCDTVRECIECLAYECHVGYCSEFAIDWNHCSDQLVCAFVSVPNVRPVSQCVADPCAPYLTGCVTIGCGILCEPCEVGRCGPVSYCSEFIAEQTHCVDRLACVGVGTPFFQPAPLCVYDPCPPRLSGCVDVSCDSSLCPTVPQACDATLSASWGAVSCDGTSVLTYHCVMYCVGGPTFYCHVPLGGRGLQCATYEPL